MLYCYSKKVYTALYWVSKVNRASAMDRVRFFTVGSPGSPASGDMFISQSPKPQFPAQRQELGGHISLPIRRASVASHNFPNTKQPVHIYWNVSSIMSTLAYGLLRTSLLTSAPTLPNITIAVSREWQAHVKRRIFAVTISIALEQLAGFLENYCL